MKTTTLVLAACLAIPATAASLSPRARELRARIQFHALHNGATEEQLAHIRRLTAVLEEPVRANAFQVRAMLAVGTWPPREDAGIRQLFVDFVKARHAAGPTEVWYRYVPTHPDRFLDQGDHRVNSRPIMVDIPASFAR